ncbi:MAG TPA: cytochrome c nitrite reductase small subunit [Candidatus Sumerlaeota bacterium]|nr:MAG: Cytochrome c-type protein NrfH [candidate division BRC1 bacterium ADurb.BinA292]HOR27915.1 cytochrome c nitrite reductase small subunit [Candidatus Sumerlaeota bacterium]HPK02903.1 cytochrome c nitrite reductase small subunit [Candidatus Sumerlaeota bacterium]
MAHWLTTRTALIAAVALGLAAGSAAGVGFYTFVYARGASYMTNDPTACVNCHVMRGQFEAWQRGSHHAVAVCNDCHTPHNLLGKWTTKALNGWHHSVAFTTGQFHEPIQITERNRKITQQTCRDCHGDIVAMIDTHTRGERVDCIRCHREVGHGD